MPSGIYERTTPNPGQFAPGVIPHNLGVQLDRVVTKLARFRSGLVVNCPRHGEHREWRLHSANNVQCKKCVRDRQRMWRVNNPIEAMLRDAAHRGKEFDLDKQFVLDLLETQDGKCALTGIAFDGKFSLDRVDSSKGYTKDNVQLVLFEVNRMKTDLPQNRFIELCQLVAFEAGKSRKK